MVPSECMDKWELPEMISHGKLFFLKKRTFPYMVFNIILNINQSVFVIRI
jgi:hypothetical protein